MENSVLFYEKYKNINLNEVYEFFHEEFYKDELLKNHRFFIEERKLGFGERPFHVLWREIVKLQNSEFRFLEIGVYKGQILSLVKSLSDFYNKKIDYYGLSPLDNSGDKFSIYDKVDYENTIINLFDNFNLDFDVKKNIIKGSSVDSEIKKTVSSLGPFDIIYIDGCHDYDCVISDIEFSKLNLSENGLIVFDDASCFKKLEIKSGMFGGHIDVCNAIKDKIETDESFEEIICVGHNRVFRKK